MDSTHRFEDLMKAAKRYHSAAKWQEKLHTLEDAQRLCNSINFPDAEQKKQDILYQIGGIRRRYGQYDKAEEALQAALTINPQASALEKAKIQGELGVVLRHRNDFGQSKDVFHNQYMNAYKTAIQAEAEMCRAIGNEGMSAYQLSQATPIPDKLLLDVAISQLQERVSRARALRSRLLSETMLDKDEISRHVDSLNAWEKIGMDRLTLCYIAAGQPEAAIDQSLESAQLQSTEDPTIRAMSSYFHGNALHHAGRRLEALRQWQAPTIETCSSLIALCKEPSQEHLAYVQLIMSTLQDYELLQSENFDTLAYLDAYDEQGFSALDYAILSGTDDGLEIGGLLLKATQTLLLRDLDLLNSSLSDIQRSEMVAEELSQRKRQSYLRRQYRSILQEHIRPNLRLQPGDSTAIREVRTICNNLLASDEEFRSIFDSFDCLKYNVFRNMGRLPTSSEKLTKKFQKQYQINDDEYVIFFSYRWIGHLDNRYGQPDDSQNSQWRRMINAVDQFLEQMGGQVDKSRLSLWLVSLCVSIKIFTDAGKGCCLYRSRPG